MRRSDGLQLAQDAVDISGSLVYKKVLGLIENKIHRILLLDMGALLFYQWYDKVRYLGCKNRTYNLAKNTINLQMLVIISTGFFTVSITF